MSLGPKLKALRDSHHLSEFAVASFLDINQGTYSKWESGKVEKLPFEAMLKLAEFYKMEKLDMINYLNEDKAIYYNQNQHGDNYLAATMHIHSQSVEDKVKELEARIIQLEANLTKEEKSKAA